MPDRILHGIGYWGWRIGAALAQRLPARPLYAFAVALGEIGYVFWTAKRRIAKSAVVNTATPVGTVPRGFGAHIAESWKRS